MRNVISFQKDLNVFLKAMKKKYPDCVLWSSIWRSADEYKSDEIQVSINQYKKSKDRRGRVEHIRIDSVEIKNLFN